MNFVVPALRDAVLAKEDEKKADGVLILEGKRPMPAPKSDHPLTAFRSAASTPSNVPAHEELMQWDKTAASTQGASHRLIGVSCHICVEEVLQMDPKSGFFIEAVLRQSGSKELTIKSKKFKGEHASGLYLEMLALVAGVSNSTITLTLSKKLGFVAIALGDLMSRGSMGRDSFSFSDGSGGGLRLSWNIDQNVAILSNPSLEVLPVVRLVTERSHYAPGETVRACASYTVRGEQTKVEAFRINIMAGITVAGNKATHWPVPFFEKIVDLIKPAESERSVKLLPGIYAFHVQFELPLDAPASGGYWKNNAGLLCQYGVEAQLLWPNDGCHLWKMIYVHRLPSPPLLQIDPMVQEVEFDKGKVRASVTVTLDQRTVVLGSQLSMKVSTECVSPVSVTADVVLTIAGKPFNQALITVGGRRMHVGSSGKIVGGREGVPLFMHQELNRHDFHVGKPLTCTNGAPMLLSVEVPKDLQSQPCEAGSSFDSFELELGDNIWAGIRWCVRLSVKLKSQVLVLEVPFKVQREPDHVTRMLSLNPDFDTSLQIQRFQTPVISVHSISRIVSQERDSVSSYSKLKLQLNGLSDIGYAFDGRLIHCAGTSDYTHTTFQHSGCRDSKPYKFNTAGFVPMAFAWDNRWAGWIKYL